MWLVIVFAITLSVVKYGLPAFGRFLYEWEYCASTAELAKNDQIKANISELTRISIIQARLFSDAFMPSPDGIFDHKETIYAKHKRMMQLRAELPGLLRSKDQDEWTVPFNQIEDIIQKFTADSEMHQQLFEEAVNTINEDLGKSVAELNADDRPDRLFWRQFSERYSIGGQQQEYNLHRLEFLYKKSDCRKPERS